MPWLRTLALTLTLSLVACGAEDIEESTDVCEGGEPFTGDETCDGGDLAACPLTCVCDDGELDASGCFNGGCMDVETSCSTGCSNFGLGEWTGDYCNR